MKKTYKMYNIDCASCAAKIEKKLNSDNKLLSANVSFPVKKIFITSKKEISQEYLEKLIQSVEPDVTIKDLSENGDSNSSSIEKQFNNTSRVNNSNIDEC